MLAVGPPSPMSVASADAQRSEPTQTHYSSKPIREIQPIADRVLADNPETRGQSPSDFGEFHAANWRILKLVVPKPDHEWMKVTLARPQAWIEAAQRDSEGRFWLEFKELGIANWANVLAIEPCPEAAVGEGRLVTGKFEHSSAEVIDLHVDGVSEPIGTTSNHPFWSEDRRDFVQAGQLRIGERLRLRDGSTPVVTAALPRSQSVPVFNLEVDGEHVYYVAASGVLVHNTYQEKIDEMRQMQLTDEQQSNLDQLTDEQTDALRGGHLAIGKWWNLGDPSLLENGDSVLDLSPDVEWPENSTALQEQMDLGLPIKDMDPGFFDGFLGREKEQMFDAGWRRIRFEDADFWVPPDFWKR